MTSPSFLTSSALVALGGGLGAWLRFLTGVAWTRAIGPAAASAFPLATLSVNVIGSLAMGLLAGWLARTGTAGEPWRLLLGVGVLGGFTTFSAFSLDALKLWQSGQPTQALIYTAASVLLSLTAVALGAALARGAFA